MCETLNSFPLFLRARIKDNVKKKTLLLFISSLNAFVVHSVCVCKGDPVSVGQAACQRQQLQQQHLGLIRKIGGNKISVRGEQVRHVQ